MTAVVYLLVDIAGSTVGSLLDPILWTIMIAAAFRVRMRYILPAAALMALVVEVLLWAIEPPELKASRFDAYVLVGRTLAGWLVGSGARFFISRRRKSQSAAPAPAPASDRH